MAADRQGSVQDWLTNHHVDKLRKAYRTGEVSKQEVELELRQRTRRIGKDWTVGTLFVLIPWTLWDKVQAGYSPQRLMFAVGLRVVLFSLGGWLVGVILSWHMRREVFK